MVVIAAGQISLKDGYKPTKKAVTISKLVGASKPLARSNHAPPADTQFIKQSSIESVVAGNGQHSQQAAVHSQASVQAASIPPVSVHACCFQYSIVSGSDVFRT